VIVIIIFLSINLKPGAYVRYLKWLICQQIRQYIALTAHAKQAVRLPSKTVKHSTVFELIAGICCRQDHQELPRIAGLKLLSEINFSPYSLIF